METNRKKEVLMMKKSVIALSMLSLLAAGCTSISKADFDALRSDVAAAKQAAQQANMNAQDAKAMSMRTDEKLNRMFRKAQMK
ncbi:MAG: hypothetical protein CSA47_02230 [Gammaproteobacteria bacterium]|nr:MAG: hypothetical protein CSA47_02230 [Gammaproteobacteria bacterium]